MPPTCVCLVCCPELEPSWSGCIQLKLVKGRLWGNSLLALHVWYQPWIKGEFELS